MALPSGLSIFDLTGRVALVTGASRGIGWEAAKALAGAGASVALVGRDPETLAARVEELAAAGHGAAFFQADLSDPRVAATVVAACEDRFGHIDILVNNAGINHRRPLQEFELEDFERVVATNLTSCFALAKAAARGMAKRGFGRIVSTSSIMSVTARPTIIAYIAAKGGLSSMTRALATELGPSGITVNAIAPGYIATEMTVPLQQNAEFDAMMGQRTPLRRWGRPEEMAGAIVYLASDAASYLTGQTIVIDGGLTIAI
ncbi:SDR family NAD(P)-dependent oxidoreductase [Stella sp.]|uniref:SDR family NAD(P)-dependent oxidoreductase n=1 Tax=Stella sp. TaxID=2912054 RepID=UPI0035AFD69B